MTEHARPYVSSVLLCALYLVSASACATVKRLPTRSAPAPIVPNLQLPAAEPAAGMGRLIVDAEDGPMYVSAVSVGATPATAKSQFTCLTPCVHDVPLGDYELYFAGLESDPTRYDKASVHVVPGTNVLRQASGKYEVANTFQPLPDLIAATGLVLTLASVNTNLNEGFRVDYPALLSLGAALAIFGLFTHSYADEAQDGASTHFVLPLTAAGVEAASAQAASGARR